MAPKSKLELIMAELSLRKKKICALALLVMLNKVENEDTGRGFRVGKVFQERKKYGLYHILIDQLRLFDKEYFFRFVRMTPQRFRFVRTTHNAFVLYERHHNALNICFH